MDAERLEGFAVLLRRQRETLLRHLPAATAVNGSPAMRGASGASAASSGASGAAAGSGHTRHALEKVEAALARLTAGSYGICTTCGREIALGRLELVPATESCLRCARRGPHARKGIAEFTTTLTRLYRR